jgi:hypothetical protein
VAQLKDEEVKKLKASGPGLWGSNSRGCATRFRVLGWKPYRTTLSEWIPEGVEFEKQLLERGK